MLFNKSLVSRFYQKIEQDNHHRYKSWEHCYREFMNKTDVDKLALHLAFYLASWGMYRGSSGLLQKDYKIHQKAVEIIRSSKYDSIRAFNKEIEKSNISTILELHKELNGYYVGVKYVRNGKDHKISQTDTLITKIMLGATGCLPAYDRYFNVGLAKHDIVQAVGKPSLNGLFDFMEQGENKGGITAVQKTVSRNGLRYPKIKILDMYFWTIGSEELKNKAI